MHTRTLFIAVSAAAMLAAGGANAGRISAGTISGQAIDPGNATAASRTFFTIASERTDAAHQTAAGGFSVTTELTTPPSIAVGAPAQSFEVTFTVSGGTIPTASAATLVVNQTAVGGATLGTTSVVQGARSATSITFIVTVNAPTVAGSANVTGFTLTTQLADDAVEGDITIASTTNVLAGGVSSLIDTVPATVVARYASAVGTPTVSSRNALAALPDFKLFGSAPSNAAPLSNANRTAEIAQNFLYTASNTGNAGGGFFASLAGAAVTRADIVDGGTVTITGQALDKLSPTLVGVTGANITSSTVTAGSAVLVLNNAGADEFVVGTTDLTLTQTATVANQVAIPAQTLTTSFAPVYASGYTAPSAVTLTSGVISLDGVNFIAPWVGGSQGVSQSVIRLSNGAAQASGPVTLRLNNARQRPAGVTSGQGNLIANQVCSTTFTVPANGDLQIGGAELQACFGDFLRGDLQITVQSAADALTAKARSVNASGDSFETTLGRFSGSTSAGAAF